MSATQNHPVVSKEQWIEASRALVAKEKEFTHQRDELSRQRRELPWVKVEEKYTFDSPHGKVTLADLFNGKNQLIVYHFMLGPDWKEGCHGCSFVSDHFDGTLPHLGARDVSLVAVSRAPLEKIGAFKKRMGWHFPWVSSFGSSFNFDCNVSFTPEQKASGKIFYNFREGKYGSDELPGASVFYKDPATGEIFHTYSTYARGLEVIMSTYGLLDMLPKGRDESEKSPMSWVKHHDRYESANVVKLGASSDKKDCCH